MDLEKSESPIATETRFHPLLTALTTAKGYVEVQGETLTTASEIIQDMITLSGDALNTTLNTTDRIALDAEFQALEEEFTSLMSRRFNGISLFGESLTIRVAIDTGETMTLSKLSLNLITFNGMTLSQLADASAAQISLESRASSLNLFIAKSGSKSNRIDRTTSFVESVSSNLQNTENKIRDIDLAIETGVFTQEQVILASAQSVIAQSNNLIQSILTFLS